MPMRPKTRASSEIVGVMPFGPWASRVVRRIRPGPNGTAHRTGKIPLQGSGDRREIAVKGQLKQQAVRQLRGRDHGDWCDWLRKR